MFRFVLVSVAVAFVSDAADAKDMISLERYQAIANRYSAGKHPWTLVRPIAVASQAVSPSKNTGEPRPGSVTDQGRVPVALQRIAGAKTGSSANPTLMVPAFNQQKDRGARPSTVKGQKFGTTPSTLDLSGGEPAENYAD
jgi:hypothetical protein